MNTSLRTITPILLAIGLLLVTFTTSSFAQSDSISIHGDVVTESGTAIENAVVWFELSNYSQESELLETKTDQDGNFLIEFPREKLREYSGLSLAFIHHPDYGIQSVRVSAALRGEMNQGEVVLKPVKGIRIKVVDHAGNQVEGVNVAVQGVRIPNERFQMIQNIPEHIAAAVKVATDEEGIAFIPYVDPVSVFSFYLDGEDLPSQSVTIDQRVEISELLNDETPPLLTVSLSLVGSFSVEFDCDEELPETEVTVHWSKISSGMGEPSWYGKFNQKTNLNDRIEIENVVEGVYKGWLEPNSELLDRKLVAEFPDMFQASSHHPKNYVIRLRTGVHFKTRLVDEDSGEPIANMRVHLRHGSSLQQALAFSDDEGYVSTYLLPGKVWLSVPYNHYLAYPTKRTVFEEIQIPDQEEFTAGDIKIPTR